MSDHAPASRRWVSRREHDEALLEFERLGAAFDQAQDTAQTRQLKIDIKDQRIADLEALLDQVEHDRGTAGYCWPTCIRCKWEKLKTDPS